MPTHESAQLKDRLAALPDHPGCYLFKDAEGRIIYIGKAKSLRNRVRSYFTAGDDGRYQYPRLVASIRDFDLILVRDEVEALKTEANLIRLHRPRFNVDLRDDKSFPFLKLTREAYPRVLLTRKPLDEPRGDIYGPFTDVRAARGLLRTLKGVLQIRDCALPLTSEKIAQGKFKLCLDYHIGRCGGPCEGKVAHEDYLRGVDRLRQFIRGRHEEIIADIEREMRDYSSQLRFEEAAHARDRILAAKQFSERQQKVDPDPIDCDAIGIAREDAYAALSVIKIRGGRIVGKSPFHMERAVGLRDDEVIESFLVRHYELADEVPEALYLPVDFSELEALETYLRNLAGHRVRLVTPQRGEKRRLVEIAQTNAEHLLAERRLMTDKRDFVPRAIKALQEHLRLAEPPVVIEAFDISHLGGVDTVASMVCFKDGKPLKTGYRLFKIRTVMGIDDYASIGEAVERRYSRLLGKKSEAVDEEAEETPEAAALPNLVLIDGGIGQLGRAKEVLDRLGLENLPVIGLAKRLEEIYLPHEREPLQLPRTSSALRLLQQVRDEAHRFAVTRQRLLRGKRQVKSKLDDIDGVGPQRRQALLKRFGSVKRIAEAPISEIAEIPGISMALAERMKRELAKVAGGEK